MDGKEVVKQKQQWLPEMMQDFLDMRDAQKAYFAHRGEHRKRVAIAKEQLADRWLERAVKAGIIAHRHNVASQSQSKLF